jgi:rhomboid-related protein 1/2/3
MSLVMVGLQVGYAAHFGGALAGLLIGLHVLRNLRPQKWEGVLWKISLALWITLALFAVAWNIFYTDYFPPSKFE